MENYQIILEPDEDIGFCARSNKMKGCFAEGDTIAESIFNFNKSAKSWILVAKDIGYLPCKNKVV